MGGNTLAGSHPSGDEYSVDPYALTVGPCMEGSLVESVEGENDPIAT